MKIYQTLAACALAVEGKKLFRESETRLGLIIEDSVNFKRPCYLLYSLGSIENTNQ